MADGKQREAWNHTAHLLAMLDNRLTFGKRDTASKPSDFHPFLLRENEKRMMNYCLTRWVSMF